MVSVCVENRGIYALGVDIHIPTHMCVRVPNADALSPYVWKTEASLFTTCIHTRTHTYAHIHIHIHTHMCACVINADALSLYGRLV
jgi:hypothetical protein